ncbi:hypothetical protein CKY47_18300 [Saccharothrix yanglingensis]|uniref:RiboL-PSP-HEPN domain-containing protein n=1 Tax=Saccharothrix yanglingensis TaxID=659496 RepID=A0ABU0X2D2_9PSEU|nr:hypothetical protein [Saccharothrix yanglingensis]
MGAFDVADLYRAAWVQAVSTLDHWIHRELYDRAFAFALNSSDDRPAKFLGIPVSVGLVEAMLRDEAVREDVFKSHLRSRFGHQSFQQPDKIKDALSYISDVALWPEVAKRLHQTPKEVTGQLVDMAKRRNKIAHETDQDHATGKRTPITDGDVTRVIDWLQRLAEAIFKAIGPPPAVADTESVNGVRTKNKWSRQDIDTAAEALRGTPAGTAVAALLAHADANNAQLKGGSSPYPSAGVHYVLGGHRRSLWQLYLSAERPVVAISLNPIASRDQELAYRMLEVLRGEPTLDAALLYPDDVLVRKHPDFELHKLGESPRALETLLAAFDLALAPPKTVLGDVNR